MSERVVVALEPWPSLAIEGAALGALHFDEVDGGLEPHRPYKLDMISMSQMAWIGALQIITARKAESGELIGYLTWTLQMDPESAGLLVADQGAWFLLPGFPRVARRMWDRSIAELKRLRVQLAVPHHRTRGRGAHLSKFFARAGAVHTKQVYQLWIGDPA